MDRSNRIRGFTLKELVAVLASVALLTAVMIPTLTHAVEIARSVTCMSNMLQISTALSMYSDDNSGLIPADSYPYGRVSNSGGSGWTWPTWSALLVTHPAEAWEEEPDYNHSGTPWGPPVDYLDSPELIQCPQDESPLNEYPQILNGSYGINSRMALADSNAPWVQGSFYDLTATKVPDRMYLVFCNLNDGGGIYHDQAHAIVRDSASFAANPVMAWTPALRHPGGERTHVLHHDGSVRNMSWDQIRAYEQDKGPWMNYEEMSDFHGLTSDDWLTIMRLPGHEGFFLDSDFNRDASVDITDLNEILIWWGRSSPPGNGLPGDINDDGTVDIVDLNTVLIDWGKPPGF